MCDYSLYNVRTRAAKVGDELTTRQFNFGRCRRDLCWNSVTRSPAFREYPIKQRGQLADRWALLQASASRRPYAC
jgi:hypothetical protein